MLVLTRKKDQSIMIGDDIEITILAVDGDQIKLGINAPRNIEIHRKEIFLAIQDENNKAANTSMNLLQQLTNNFQRQEK
ncbi:carbon storage regulator CsrA [Anaerobacillus sp. CMMVII]|uniref:carbon storage regulator CsrA n=1 Tax=Anaerobacillus sp. CMMVII TaxID=2755588 RepID=UPI0021B7C213|nr:carbon storage regulator CsrA [Anaerobacillus sp. CMMVII]MCT8140150.1 carbon storage regulator CsrA [Anaerobacillus sp. CMMVII]